jgi:dethiobiotin synthetase
VITVFVTGTGTEVGKTWWTVATIRALRELGATVAARKPAQSGVVPGESDAELMAGATGEPAGVVCPPHRWYEAAVAPPMASPEPLSIRDLLDGLAPAGEEVAVLFVEGAGGPRSPLAHDGDNVDFAAALAPDLVVLVADAGLGVINAVRLAAAPFAGVPVVVALNRYRPEDPLHAENRRWLEGEYGLPTVTEPGELARRLSG